MLWGRRLLRGRLRRGTRVKKVREAKGGALRGGLEGIWGAPAPLGGGRRELGAP